MNSKTDLMALPMTASLWDNLARKALLKLLTELRYGQLSLLEQGQVVCHVGDSQSPLHAEIDVLDARFYRQLLVGGSIGAGESFINQHWQTPNLTAVIAVFAANLPLIDALEAKFNWLMWLPRKTKHWLRRNHMVQAKKNIAAHYDLGNAFYQQFLDPTMQYSSAIYPSPNASLAQAQLHKLQTICDQLQLNANDHVLEIGTGWGGLAIYAAQHYGCQVTTTTISEAQYQYAKDKVAAAGLSDRITLLRQDYRELTGQFNKLVSIEMIEAVGEQYLPSFVQTCQARLAAGGTMLLQVITIQDQRLASYRQGVDFIQQYIFPGGFLPSLTLLQQLFTAHSDITVRAVRDIGLDYAQTCQHWWQQVKQQQTELLAQGFDQRFLRLWHFYLAYCEAGFRTRRVSTVQMLLTRNEYS